MEIFYAPNGNLQIDNATLIFKNFEGRGDMYNRPGDRNFAIRIDDIETAEELRSRGWNVSIKEGRDPEEGPRMHLKVKLAYKENVDNRGNVKVSGPNAYLWTGNKRNVLDRESIACLDHIEIGNVNLDVRGYDWVVNGREGRSAWLNAIEVFQNIDRFAARYESMSEDEKLPF